MKSNHHQVFARVLSWSLVLLQICHGIVATPLSSGEYADDPYRWTGLVQAGNSWDPPRGSGSVIKHPNLVVSCAHLVFDSDVGRWIGGSDSTWTRAHNGTGPPPFDQRIPLAGFWRWDSYQDSWWQDRSNGMQTGRSSPETFSRDFIVYWSYEFTANGGYGGYYTGDTKRLLGSAGAKMITGYPADPYDLDIREWGMWKTGPFSSSFVTAHGRFMVNGVGGTSGGNSGGPVWVRHSDGRWYQAAVLVSSGPGVVAFDSSVQQMLDAAAADFLPDEPRLVVTDPRGLEVGSAEYFHFGEAAVGGSTTSSLTLANEGTGNLVIHGIERSGGWGDFTVGFTGSVTIPEGGSVRVPVTFSPLNSGDRQGRFHLESNDTRYNYRALGGGSYNRFTLQFRGRGVALPGSFEELGVGEHLSGRLSSGGTEKVYWVTIDRPGLYEFGTESSIDTVGELLTLEGDRIGYGDDFGIRWIAGKPGPSGNDFRFTEELSSGNYLLVVGGYDASVAGNFVVKSRRLSEAITVRSGQETLFQGEVTARLKLPPAEVGTETTWQLEIENTGDVSVQFEHPRIVGAGAGEFVVGPLDRTSLGAGRKAFFELAFRPTRDGVMETRIEILKPGGEGQLMGVVMLTAEGISGTESFGAYAAAAGLSGEDALPGAEPFGDGVPNLLKFAFNMDATGPDTSMLTPGTGTSGLPAFGLAERDGETVFQVEFVRRKGSGLVYTPKHSTDLGDFQPMTGAEELESINDEWERVRVSQPCDPAVTPRCFGVVEVMLPAE